MPHVHGSGQRIVFAVFYIWLEFSRRKMLHHRISKKCKILEDMQKSVKVGYRNQNVVMSRKLNLLKRLGRNT
jgi:hypothetical protein